MKELDKISDPQSRQVINETLIECLSFGEWCEVMRSLGAPAWFSLVKCWEEETGEEVKP